MFPFAVTDELSRWKEQHERERRWFTMAEAAEAVDEPDLRALIRSFGASEFRAAAHGRHWCGLPGKRGPLERREPGDHSLVHHHPGQRDRRFGGLSGHTAVHLAR